MAQTYEMMAGQKNIWNMSKVYSSEPVAIIGGYTVISKDKTDFYIQMLMKTIEQQSAFHLSILKDGAKGEVFGFREWMDWCPEEFVYENAEMDELERRVTEWFEQPLPIEKRLFDVCIIHGKKESILCEKFHHLIMDRKAIFSLIQWQDKIVQGEINILEDEAVLDTRYIESLEDNAARHFAKKEDVVKWFKREFKKDNVGFTETPQSSSSKADCAECFIDDALNCELHNFSLENNVSIESIFYLALLMERCELRGITDAVLGRLTSGRRRKERDVIGMFVQLMPISFDIKVYEKGDVISSCRCIQEKFLDSVRYAGYSMREMEQNSESLTTKLDTIVSFFPESMTKQIESKYKVYDGRYIDTPLRIWFNEGVKKSQIKIFYQTECFCENEIHDLIVRINNLLTQIVSNVSYDDLCMLSEEDQKVYGKLNDVQWFKPIENVPGYFRHLGKQERERFYIQDSETRLNYEDTVCCLERCEKKLVSLEVKQGDVVAIHVNRSVYLPIYMVAVMELGAVFLPVSPKDSKERKKMLTSQAKAVICEPDTQLENGTDFSDIKEQYDEDVLFADIQLSKNQLKNRCNKKDLAYILYTSGSTGTPKGAKIRIYSLMCRLMWMQGQYGKEGVILQKTVNTFDVSIWELLLPFISGMGLYVMRQGDEKYPDVIADTMIKGHISWMHFVPSMLTAFLNYVEKKQLNSSLFPDLKNVFVSGEALYREDVIRFYKCFPDKYLHNLYGPTECTIDVTYEECSADNKEVAIGKPVAGTQAYVIAPGKKKVRTLPCNTIGELCITGDLVGAGYVQDGGQRKQMQGGYFKWNKRNAYRTGDMVYLGRDAKLYYVGRNDEQCKLRGMRIDLKEIEQVLLAVEEIKQAIVMVVDNRICAYYVTDKKKLDVRGIVAKKLPYYAIPSEWIALHEFPLSNNGKTDREKLKLLHGDKAVYVEPKSDLEICLWDIAHSIMKVRKLSIKDNLFDCGLDSILALLFVDECEKKGISMTYSMIYTYPTIYDLAQQIMKKNESVNSKKEAPTHKLVNIDVMHFSGAERAVVLVPYGGAGSEIYGGVARSLSSELAQTHVRYVNDNRCANDKIQDADILCIHAKTDCNASIQQLALEAAESLSEYKEVVLLGYCVGSALATELAMRLEQAGVGVNGVCLIASLPEKQIHIGTRAYTPWDMMSDRMIYYFLTHLHANHRQTDGEEQITKKRIGQFRLDTKRFFSYFDTQSMNGYRETIKAPVVLLFAEKDPLTKGHRMRYKRWKKYFCGKMKVISLRAGEGHFFLDKREKLIVRSCLHLLQGSDQ